MASRHQPSYPGLVYIPEMTISLEANLFHNLIFVKAFTHITVVYGRKKMSTNMIETRNDNYYASKEQTYPCLKTNLFTLGQAHIAIRQPLNLTENKPLMQANFC